MSAQTTITVTFTGGGPVTLPINPLIDYRQTLKNIFLAGGFWYATSTGLETFVPSSQITSATAQ
jgi:hypothetical protein